jgi:hypothetical protein
MGLYFFPSEPLPADLTDVTVYKYPQHVKSGPINPYDVERATKRASPNKGSGPDDIRILIPRKSHAVFDDRKKYFLVPISSYVKEEYIYKNGLIHHRSRVMSTESSLVPCPSDTFVSSILHPAEFQLPSTATL